MNWTVAGLMTGSATVLLWWGWYANDRVWDFRLWWRDRRTRLQVDPEPDENWVEDLPPEDERVLSLAPWVVEAYRYRADPDAALDSIVARARSAA